MHKILSLIAGLVVSLHGPAQAQRSATEAWTTNRLAIAVSPIYDRLIAIEAVTGTVTSVSTDALRLVNAAVTQWIDGTGAVWQASGPLTVSASGTGYNGPADGSVLLFDAAYYAETGGIYYTNAVWMVYIDPDRRWYLYSADDPGWGAYWSDSFSLPASLTHASGLALGVPTLAMPAPSAPAYPVTRVAYLSDTSPLASTNYVNASLASFSSAVSNIAESAASSDALRLVNSNATCWIDGTGGVWRVEQASVADSNTLVLASVSGEWNGDPQGTVYARVSDTRFEAAGGGYVESAGSLILCKLPGELDPVGTSHTKAALETWDGVYSGDGFYSFGDGTLAWGTTGQAVTSLWTGVVFADDLISASSVSNIAANAASLSVTNWAECTVNVNVDNTSPTYVSARTAGTGTASNFAAYAIAPIASGRYFVITATMLAENVLDTNKYPWTVTAARTTWGGSAPVWPAANATTIAPAGITNTACTTTWTVDLGNPVVGPKNLLGLRLTRSPSGGGFGNTALFAPQIRPATTAEIAAAGF